MKQLYTCRYVQKSFRAKKIPQKTMILQVLSNDFNEISPESRKTLFTFTAEKNLNSTCVINTSFSGRVALQSLKHCRFPLLVANNYYYY